MEYDRIRSGIFAVPRIRGLEPGSQTRPRSIPSVVGVDGRLYLPAVKVSLNINVINTIARTVLTQHFSNDDDKTITEASYIFPLYDGSSIVSFNCWVGGSPIVGVVEARSEAHVKFKSAVAGKVPAILLDEHTSEVFQVSLGKIPARTPIRVEITYLNELKPDIVSQGVLLTIPTSIASRYGTSPVSDVDYALGTEPGMNIHVEISMPLPIIKLESPTHTVSIELGPKKQSSRANTFRDLARGASSVQTDLGQARVTLSNDTPTLGQDFVLRISVADPGLLSPRAIMERCPRHPGHSAVQVSFTPQNLFEPEVPQQGLSKEVIFLADRSESMENKILGLRRSLNIFLQSLPKAGIYFNIASFGSSCSLLWPTSKLYDQDTLVAAQLHLKNDFKANKGGTEILDAVKKVVESRLVNQVQSTEILVLTDGEVWDVETMIDYIRSTKEKLGDKIRFFALGIGEAVSHKLVEGIGRYGGGFAEVVPGKVTRIWEASVVKMLHGALSAPNWDCEISLVKGQHAVSELPSTQAEVDNETCVKAPYQLSSLHSFTRFMGYFLIENSGAKYHRVTVKGRSSYGKNFAIGIPIEYLEVSEPLVLSLAAKAILKDMENDHSQLHASNKAQKKGASSISAMVKAEGERIGIQWSTTSKWNSFVGVNSSRKLKVPCNIHRNSYVELAQLTEPRGSYRRGSNTIKEAADSEDETSDAEETPYRFDRQDKRDGDGDGASGGGGYSDQSNSGGGPTQDYNGAHPRGGNHGSNEHNNGGGGSSGHSQNYGQRRGENSPDVMQNGQYGREQSHDTEKDTNMMIGIEMTEEEESNEAGSPMGFTNTSGHSATRSFSSTWLFEEGSAYREKELHKKVETGGNENSDLEIPSSPVQRWSISIHPFPTLYRIIDFFDNYGVFRGGDDGDFVIRQLLTTFKPNTISLIHSILQNQSSIEEHAIEAISRTIVSYVYIRKAYSDCSEIWHLLTDKINSQLHDVISNDSLQQHLKDIAVNNWIGIEVEDEFVDPDTGFYPSGWDPAGPALAPVPIIPAGSTYSPLPHSTYPIDLLPSQGLPTDHPLPGLSMTDNIRVPTDLYHERAATVSGGSYQSQNAYVPSHDPAPLTHNPFGQYYGREATASGGSYLHNPGDRYYASPHEPAPSTGAPTNNVRTQIDPYYGPAVPVPAGSYPSQDQTRPKTPENSKIEPREGH